MEVTGPHPSAIAGAFPGLEPPSLDALEEAAASLARAPSSERAAAERPRSFLFEVSLVVLLAICIALLLKVYVAEAYEIKGRSMEPNFREQQRVMVLKVLYDIERGDVVIFSSAENSHKDLIKRVVGLPGDNVRVEDGVVYINDEKLDESAYLRGPVERGYHERRVVETVPEGRYYVLGDNRRDSQDSRVFHAIDAASIKGKVVLLWWPMEELRSF